VGIDRSWVPVPEDSPFPLENLPFGVFSTDSCGRRIGVAIGDHVVDLGAAASAVGSALTPLLSQPLLDDLMSAGPLVWSSARQEITSWITEAKYRRVVQPLLHPVEEVKLQLPFTVSDYVDFYSSEHHAANVGRIVRPGSAALPPQWRDLPMGYHGRSGTVAVSGTPVRRPWGQFRGDDEAVTFRPTERLDFEAEVGFVVGAASTPGTPVPVGSLRDHVFGVCLLNDWSARDIQSFEYVPLGPLLGKSFLTSVSPWIVPLAALDAARVPPPQRSREPLPHLRDWEHHWGLDISLEVRLNGHLISKPPFAAMYWTPAQQLAHLTSNGAHVRTGDLFASGTVSGPEHDQVGCLLELSSGGTQPFATPDGHHHTYLDDGDEVVISATAPGVRGTRIGFGRVVGKIEPPQVSWPNGG
jgi:fumarylacetoacetase